MKKNNWNLPINKQELKYIINKLFENKTTKDKLDSLEFYYEVEKLTNYHDQERQEMHFKFLSVVKELIKQERKKLYAKQKRN